MRKVFGDAALKGVESFRADGPGDRRLLAWLGSFGPLALLGVEGIGSTGPASPGTCTTSGLDRVEGIGHTQRQAA